MSKFFPNFLTKLGNRMGIKFIYVWKVKEIKKFLERKNYVSIQ
nr:MAG TPA: hypothetical protein [Caudoviricetes sp.]